MAKRKKENPNDWDESLFPKLIIKDGKPFVTDGYIGSSKVTIVRQPSMETVEMFNKFLAKKEIEARTELQKLRSAEEC